MDPIIQICRNFVYSFIRVAPSLSLLQLVDTTCQKRTLNSPKCNLTVIFRSVSNEVPLLLLDIIIVIPLTVVHNVERLVTFYSIGDHFDTSASSNEDSLTSMVLNVHNILVLQLPTIL
jgi:hypothetical protein